MKNFFWSIGQYIRIQKAFLYHTYKFQTKILKKWNHFLSVSEKEFEKLMADQLQTLNEYWDTYTHNASLFAHGY